MVTPDAGDVEALAYILAHTRRGAAAKTNDYDRDQARVVLASDWLANHVAAAREADRAEVERLRVGMQGAKNNHDQARRALVTRAEAAEERLAEARAQGAAEALREFADLVDSGPTFLPLRPTVFSAMARERADAATAR